MSETLAEVAPVATEETTAAVEQGAQLGADQAMAEDRARVRQLAGRERLIQARVRLEIGSIVRARMAANCEAFANSDEERPNIRSQTARLFAIDLSSALGTKIDDKEVYRLIRATALRELLPSETATALGKLSWDTIRTLVRWVDWDAKDDEYALRFQVDIGVKDDKGRTTRDIDATPILNELIPALVASPKSASTVRKLMDERENRAREAELVFLLEPQRKKAVAAKAMADRVAANEARAALFDGFARRIVNAKLSADDVLDELFRRGLIPQATAELDPSTLANLTADEASIIGKLWIQANNVDAIAALYATIKPLVAEATVNTQPSLGATRTLKATG